MGKIVTKRGEEISLDIPAIISSFEEVGNFNTHTTRGKLKVFFIGKCGDIRIFTREFSEQLLKSLPGTPVVAFYDEEEEDFKGHNGTQYVYGYVPTDAVPEFVEDSDGKTWAMVDVDLFTERDDNIGHVASKIIGKHQSLELNPETVDYKLYYKDGELSNIIFTSGSFYGLSVLGDNQTPAFAGSSFFTEQIIEKIKQFSEDLKNNGGNETMELQKFFSLPIGQKFERFSQLISNLNLFDCFMVTDFDETRIIVEVLEDDALNTYAVNYTWDGDDNYNLDTNFYRVYKIYTEEKAEQDFVEEVLDNDFGCGDKKKEECVEEEVEDENEDEDGIKKEEEDIESCVNIKPKDDGDDDKQEEEEEEIPEDGSGEEETTIMPSPKKEDMSELAQCKEEEDNGAEEKQPEEQIKKEDEKGFSTYTSTLSNEERSELNLLRKEKKLNLIESFNEYLSEETIREFRNGVDNYDFAALETALKVASFDSNKLKINEREKSGSIVLPTIEQHTYGSEIDRLIAANINKR